MAFALSHGGAYLALPSLVFAGLIGVVVFVTARHAPDAAGSGIPHLKGYLRGDHPFRAGRILLFKFLGGVAGIGSGLALGREGPTVQMGAAVGKLLGGRFAASGSDRRILISAGAGAGLAAAFNAPLAGLFFVLEELHGTFRQAVLVAAFVASVTADVVCRLVVGRLPVFHTQVTTCPEVGVFPSFLLLGTLIGFLGLLFNKSLLWTSDCVSRRGRSGKLILGVLLGGGFGFVGLLAPASLGTGGELIASALTHQVLFRDLAVYFVLRFVFTMLSYGTGAPGGIFAPLLLLGVLSGSFFGAMASSLGQGASLGCSVWAVLGMAGFFSAVVRAPITGTVLILEMTAAYDLLLPLMIVSLIAYAIPEYFRDKPIYEALMDLDLQRKASLRRGAGARGEAGGEVDL